MGRDALVSASETETSLGFEDDEVLTRIREVRESGFGSVLVTIENGHVKHVEKKESFKWTKDRS